MAYVIFTANGDEIDRRDLIGPVTIGRAQDVDVPVRDILLSRKHCKLEPSGDGQWVVTDLGSKNGTYVGYRQITRHPLKDGDGVRIGRTHMTFKAGAFEPAPAGTKRRDIVRPADPTEALAGTVAGFILVEPGEVEREAGAPIPQPRPPEPTSYASEDVYGMLSEIASSSWDSIMAQASRPIVMERPLPRPHAYKNAPRVASRPRVAFCLQAPVAETTTAASTTTEASTTQTVAEAIEPTSSPRQRWRSSTRWWQISRKARHQIALGVLSAVATAVLVGAWVIAVNQGPPSSLAAPLPRPPASDWAPEAADITFPMHPADRHDLSPSPRELASSGDAWKMALRIASLHLLPAF